MTHKVSAVSSIPSKDVPRSSVTRSEFTFSCKALARARVIGPLGGLGGFDAVASVGRAVSAPNSYINLRGAPIERLDHVLVKTLDSRLELLEAFILNYSPHQFVSIWCICY